MIMFQAPKRRVDRVFIHCTASDQSIAGIDLRDLIKGWHLERKFNDIGYHFLIDKGGALLPGRDLEKTPAAQRGHNTGTIAISVHGLESFTPVSMQTLRGLCGQINDAYSGRVSFHGYSEVSNKSCPVFDYRAQLQLDRFGRIA